MVARLAPEPTDLLASLRLLRAESRVDMPRALMLATLIVATLFAAAGALRASWPDTEPPAMPVFEPVDFTPLQPPPTIAPAGRPAPRVAPGTPVDPHAVPNVVENAPESVVEPSTGGGDDPTGVDVDGPSPGRVGPGPIVASPVDPLPGWYEPREVEPEPIESPRPRYDDLAQQAGVEGTVVLRALVERDGHVSQVLIVRSVPMLDECARVAIVRWRFSPARNSGVPVRAWVVIPVRFSLRDGH